ncbi:hypothetical protein MTIM_52880 [Mycobacterium timonense]|uniref:Uncharacterized protein n=1 Tax=Mycobacterium timonense TaxID=701043 RepID=A0A7I9ZEI3_9MYCO|nr:hypothetical protein MTIM_52880 [Mycobacterium timonense]
MLIAATRRVASSESPPRSKKVVDADALDAEHVGVDAGEDFLDRAGRSAVTGILEFGCRQGAGIEFAVDRERQRVQHDHAVGTVFGQPLGQRAAQLAGSTVPVLDSVT